MPDGNGIRWGRTAIIVGGALAIWAGVEAVTPDWDWDDQDFHHELAAVDIVNHDGLSVTVEADTGDELDLRDVIDESSLEAYEADMEEMAARMEVLADELDARGGHAPEIEAEMEDLGLEMGKLGLHIAGEGLREAFAD